MQSTSTAYLQGTICHRKETQGKIVVSEMHPKNRFSSNKIYDIVIKKTLIIYGVLGENNSIVRNI